MPRRGQKYKKAQKRGGVMVVIRLSRRGAKNRAKYRLAVADSRKPVKGRFIEWIGHYDPLLKGKKAVIDIKKYEAWIQKGAQPSQRVKSLVAKFYKKGD